MSRLLALTMLGGLMACGDKDEYVPTEDPIDVDGDGYPEDEDCNDLVSTIYPGAVEVCDEIDNNCNGEIDEGAGRTFYQDDDGDGYGQTSATMVACEPPSGYAVEDDDCDDNEAAANPGIAIDTCDDIDNDCDKLTDEDADFADYYRDQDGDGYGLSTDTVNACEAPSGYTGSDGDCDDSNKNSFPDAPERCDGEDNDCDTVTDNDVVDVWYSDSDSDSYGDPGASINNCDPADGYVADSSDCNDTNPDINPNGAEVCDGADNNCDDNIDEEICAESWTGELYQQAGIFNVPTQRDCELFWVTTGERIGYDKSECPGCEFAFSIDYSYDTTRSYDNGLCAGSYGLPVGVSYTMDVAYTSDFYGYGPVWYTEMYGYYGYFAWYPFAYAGAISDGDYLYETGYEDYPYGGRYYTNELIETATLK